MSSSRELPDPRTLAANIDAEIAALEKANAPNMRAIRKRYSRTLREASPTLVLALADTLLKEYGRRWVAYELIAEHDETFARLDAAHIEELGQGINSWDTVDPFARTIAGPAWMAGQIEDAVIHRWARSDSRWWRRAALVSTVAFHTRSTGGTGDTERTLAVCEMLVDDGDDMVVKALSWALRDMISFDADAVRTFLHKYEDVLAARVLREVTNKLETGLKNPGRRRARCG